MHDRITGFRSHRIRVPARATHSHGSGDVSSIHSVMLEVTTEAGRTGWGEAAPWPVFTGTAEAAQAALDTYLCPPLIGSDPVQVEAHMTRSDAILVGHTEAKAALETALLDIAGQIAGLSVAEMLGGRHRDRIPMSFSIANPDFAADLEDVARMWDDGVRIFKLKTGFADHAFDVMRLDRLRAEYGDQIRLRIDYNQGLVPAAALRQLRDLEPFAPEFIEQPVPMNDRTVMAAITRALDTPVMADESVFDPRQAFEGARDRIADIFSLKIMKSGGARRALQVAAIARAAGIDVYGGCMFETGVAHTMGTHLMAAVPNLTLGCEFYMSNYYISEDILTEPFTVTAGDVIVPDRPGLGIAVNRDVLARYSVDQT